jgi:hypothetical protein
MANSLTAPDITRSLAQYHPNRLGYGLKAPHGPYRLGYSVIHNNKLGRHPRPHIYSPARPKDALWSSKARSQGMNPFHNTQLTK